MLALLSANLLALTYKLFCWSGCNFLLSC